MEISFFLFFLIPVMANSQVHVEFGGGIESLANSPLIKIAAGFTRYNTMVEGVSQFTTTRKINSSNYFGGKLGYNLHNVIPAVGYYYNYVSADNTKLNHSAIGYSIKYVYTLGDPGGLYIEATYIETIVQLTVGFHFRFSQLSE